MFAGVKNNYGTLGVTSSVQYGNCSGEQIEEYHLENIFKWAQDEGAIDIIFQFTSNK